MALDVPIDTTAEDIAKKGVEVRPQESVPMTDEEVAQFFQAAFTVGDETRRPREQIWRIAWELYNGQYDWTGKANWQSKSNIPKVRQAVDRAASSFRRSLIQLDQFYQAESESRLGHEKGLFSIMLIDYWLKQARFIEEFIKAVKSGLITGISVMKVFWDWSPEMTFDVSEEMSDQQELEFGIEVGMQQERKVNLKQIEELKGKLCVKTVDPFRFWIIPRFDTVGVIEKVEMQMSDLEELARRGIYSHAAVEDVKNRRESEFVKKQDEAHRKGETLEPQSMYFKPVDVYHYWGDIFDDMGNRVMENGTFTVANKEVVLRKPRKNPFFHGKIPYVWGSPYVVPFSNYNRGMVEDVIGLATMITEISNLIVDGAQFEAAKGFTVDIDQINDRSELRQGIYPGVVLTKKGLQTGPVDKKMIEPIDTGQVPSESFAVVSFMNSEFNESVGIPSSMNRPGRGGGKDTATEVQIRAGASAEGTEDAARTLEEMVLNPLLDLTIKTVYQFHDDYTLARLVENFPRTSSTLRMMTPEERYVLMVGDFEFRARGLSIMLDKQASLQKIIDFMTLAGHIPGVLQRVNVDAFLEEIFMALGWNPQKMLIQPGAQVSSAGLPGGGRPQVPFPNPVTPNAQTPAQAQSGVEGIMFGGSQNNPMAITGQQGQ